MKWRRQHREYKTEVGAVGCDKNFCFIFWKDKSFSLGFANLHLFWSCWQNLLLTKSPTKFLLAKTRQKLRSTTSWYPNGDSWLFSLNIDYEGHPGCVTFFFPPSSSYAIFSSVFAEESRFPVSRRWEPRSFSRKPSEPQYRPLLCARV